MGWVIEHAALAEGSEQSAGTTIVLVTTDPVAAGGTVFLVGFGGQNPVSFADDSGFSNDWQLDEDHANGDVVWVASAYCPSGLPDNTEITVTYSLSNNQRLVHALSATGGATTGRLDQTDERLAFGEGPGWSSGTVTPSEANTLVIGVYGSNGDAVPPQSSTPDSGWTEFADFGDTNEWITAVYQIVPNTAARTPSGVMFTNSGAADQVGVVANYKEGVGGVDPVNTVAPVVSGTKHRTGTLTATAGTWTGDPTITFGYQWQRDDSGGGSYTNIAGANTNSRVLSQADVGCQVRCLVTGTNGTGSSVGTSNAVVVGELYHASAISTLLVCGNSTGDYIAGVSGDDPVCTANPVASGVPTVGQTVTTTTGTWENASSFAFQWQRSANGTTGWANIGGATSQNYVCQFADIDNYLRAVVTAT